MGIGWLKSAQEGASDLMSGSGGSLLSKVGSMGLLIGKMLMYFVIIGFVVIFIVKWMVFNRDVYIFKRYATGLKMVKVKGRFYKGKDGKYRFEITKSNPLDFKRKSIPITGQEFFINTGKSEAIFLLQVGPDDYKPIRLQEELIELSQEDMIPILDKEGVQLKDEKTGELLYQKVMPRINVSVMDLNASNHALQVHKEIVEKYKSKSKLAFYAPMMMVFFGMIFLLVALWIVLGKVDSMNDAMTSAAVTVAEALRDAGKTVL